MDRDEFRAWLAFKRIENPEYKWTTLNATPNESGLPPRAELLQHIWGEGNEKKWQYLSSDDTRRMILESIWQVEIINGHFHDIFYRQSEPKLLLRNDKFNIILYDGKNEKTFSNITLGMINGLPGFSHISHNELSSLHDVELPDSTRPEAIVKYKYSESIEQIIVDVDDEVAIIFSEHSQTAFWNNKTKRIMPFARHMKVYKLEYLDDNKISLYEVLALKEEIEDEKSDHSSMINKIVLSEMKIHDFRKSPLCTKLIEEVVR